MVDWHQLEPPLNKEGVYVPHLRTMLDLGSFLTYAFDKVKSVARLVYWKMQDGNNKMVYLNFYNVTSSAPTASSQ
jgi:hypothetical protein